MLRVSILAACLIAGPASAENAELNIARDHYEAGSSLRFDGSAVTDLFMAGNRVAIASPVAGSAHVAGRRVSIETPVAGDVFAVGYAVSVNGTIGGDASLTGYEVSVGPVGGNLRAAGSEVRVGSVGGYALISGAEITLQGAISGDAVLLAEDIIFEPGAVVAGQLTIYAEDTTSVAVPPGVAPAARITIKAMDQYNAKEWSERMPAVIPFWQIVGGFLMGVLISGLIAAMVIAIAPKAAQKWREAALAHPGHAIWSGFLVTSALAGSGFVLMLTIIGVFLFPVMMILTMLAICAGYALGTYVLAAKLWLASGRDIPAGLLGKFLLACLGALLAGLAWLVPVAGWFFVLGLTMLGVGTLAAFAVPESWRLLRRDTLA
jgi:hypothetical protein